MRFLRYLALVATVIIAIASCHPSGPNPPPGPDADASGPPPAPSGASCQTWCDHAADLGCNSSMPTPAGSPCVDVCKNFDGPLALDVACRTSAASCAAADECENGKLAVHFSATCAGWCKHAAELKCAAAKPTDAGSSCEAVCANANSASLKWNLKCRVTAKTCAAADACEK